MLKWPVALLVSALIVAVMAVADQLLHVRTVTVAGDTWALDKGHVLNAVLEARERTLFGVDIDRMEKSLSKHPLVQSAHAKSEKQRVSLMLKGRQPVARHKKTGVLIDNLGETYSQEAPNGVTVYDGPYAQFKLVAYLLEKAHALLADGDRGMGGSVKLLRFDERQGWSMQLDNGWLLILGFENMLARVGRYASVARTLRELYGGLRPVVDLRNRQGGMAVLRMAADSSEKET